MYSPETLVEDYVPVCAQEHVSTSVMDVQKLVQVDA